MDVHRAACALSDYETNKFIKYNQAIPGYLCTQLSSLLKAAYSKSNVISFGAHCVLVPGFL